MSTRQLPTLLWLYHRFPLSLRDVQEMMAERGVITARWASWIHPAENCGVDQFSAIAASGSVTRNV
jgi:hypothetical protein